MAIDKKRHSVREKNDLYGANYSPYPDVTYPDVVGQTPIAGSFTNQGDLATLDTVDSGQIDSGAVTETKIGTGAVVTAKIGAGAVVTAKIDDGAVVTAKIGAGAVVTAKIDDGAVVTAKIDDDATLIPGAAYTAAGITCPNATLTTVQTVSWTSTGTATHVDFTCQFAAAVNPTAVLLSFYLDGSLLTNMGNLGTYAAWTGFVVAGSFSFTPTSGARTLTARLTTTATASATAYYRSMTVKEIKK